MHLEHATSADTAGWPGAFVIGSGRCGSTLLSNMLRLHGEILSLSELFSSLGGAALLDEPELDGADFFARLATCDADLKDLLRIEPVPEVLARRDASLLELSPLELVTLPHLTNRPNELFAALRARLRAAPRATPARHFDALFYWLGVREQRRVWIERSGGSIEYADALLRYWPGAKLIVVVRDGVDCARSMAAHPLFRARLARLLFGGSLRAEECLSTSIDLERFGIYWSALMQRTLVLLRSVPRERLLLVRYEDLVAVPLLVLDRLATFLGLTVSEAWLREAASLCKPNTTSAGTLVDDAHVRLERACKPGMRVLDRIQRSWPLLHCTPLESTSR